MRCRGRAACVDVAGISLTEGGRTKMRDKSIQCDDTCTKLVQEAACVDAVAAYVDVAGFLFNVVKEDINFKKISAARQRWNVRSKVLSDELDEDEDLHNKLKCDQDTSDEQIATDNVKISTLETSIFPRKSASVAQLTAEAGTL